MLTAAIVIIIVVILFFVFFPAKKADLNPAAEIITHSLANAKVKALHTAIIGVKEGDSPDSHERQDESIIDVSGLAETIPQNPLTIFEPGVPYWKHQYVYSHSELNGATAEQQAFYNSFKQSFLNDIFYDVEGNANYPFILMFDLLNNEFQNHKDFQKLEKQLDLIGYYYPKTNSYAKFHLSQKLRLYGDDASADRIERARYSSYSNLPNTQEQYYGGGYWGLGTRYKNKLKLTDAQQNILNKISAPNNNFFNVEFCGIEVIKLFLKIIDKLNESYTAQGSDLKKELSEIAHIVAIKHFKYKQDGTNYNYSIDPTINSTYGLLFKSCENAVREVFGHKRKLNIESYYNHQEIISLLETKIFKPLNELLPGLLDSIEPPNEATCIELNSLNTSRWKLAFEQIEDKFKTQPDNFFAAILELASLNKKNPAIENLFFEASKIMAKKDKLISLKLYIYYLYYDLKSANFDNKQLTKTLQKSLFTNNEQLHIFESIIGNLIKDHNLEKAIDAIGDMYKVKRKAIKLDTSVIKEAEKEHSETVELLSEFLKDDYEDEVTIINATQINHDEVKLNIVAKTGLTSSLIYIEAIQFSNEQTEALEMFVKNNFIVLQKDLEVFARSKGKLKNQLIESINEGCFETLDDVLIEEEDDLYIINQSTYQKLIKK